MKALSSFAAMTIGGGDRISFTYDEVDDQTGEPTSTNNKASFYVIDNELRGHVEAIRDYIRTNKLAD